MMCERNKHSWVDLLGELKSRIFSAQQSTAESLQLLDKTSLIRSLCALLGGLELCVYSSCYFVSRFCPKNLRRWEIKWKNLLSSCLLSSHVFRIGTGHGKHTIQTWHHVSRIQFWFGYPASTSGCLHRSTSYTSKEMTVDTYAWPTSTEPKQWVLTNSISGTMLLCSSVLCECVSW